MASPTQAEPLSSTDNEFSLPSPSDQLSLTGKRAKDTSKEETGIKRVRIESGYTRRPYIPKPVVVVKCGEPVVVHDEIREVAAHVRRRDYQKVAALPPPSSKKGAVSKMSGTGQGGGGQDEGEKCPGKSNEDGGDGGDEDNHDAGDIGLVAEHEDDTDEEYESAPEEPWPENVWNDDSATVRDVVPASDKEISTTIEELQKFLTLKKYNFETVKFLESVLEGYGNDLLAMHDVPNFDGISKAKDDLGTIHRTLLDDDGSLSQNAIEKQLNEIASRMDKIPKDFYQMKDDLRKAFLQQTIAETMTSETAESTGAVEKKDFTWTGRRHYRLSQRLDCEYDVDHFFFSSKRIKSYALVAYKRSVWRLQGSFPSSSSKPNQVSKYFSESLWNSRVLVAEEELRNAGWIFQYLGIWRPADLNVKVGGQYLYIPEIPSEYLERLPAEERQYAEREAWMDPLFGAC
ncbi:hypothetical protein BKA65DRAFT_24260 [Rhexocercosporidium sp. MPI-PUGE-AT-0058]|nr:hypothetical protein BKA65DRAFT_24260 [Rhexocercosporidium sp. MPI-PUGE-AT-0058]